MVQQPPRGPDDDRRAALQSAFLGGVGDAAVDRHFTGVPVFAQPAELPGDLDRKLTGGDHDQGLGPLQPGVDTLEHRDGERRGLPGPGLGLGQQVAAGLQDGDGLFLDGRRGHIAEIGDRSRDLGVDLEAAEASGSIAIGAIRRSGGGQRFSTNDISVSVPACRVDGASHRGRSRSRVAPDGPCRSSCP
ncbi:MAG: hypothetical protein NVS9B6_06070 [Candidatus Limnocylindrales bacterium]